MSEDKQYYHNKGEQDAAAGHDSMRPHGITRLVTDIFTSEETQRRQAAEDEAYVEGYTNVEKQKDRAK